MAKTQFEYIPQNANLYDIRRYLFRLADHLSVALNNIGVENMSGDLQNTVTAMMGVSEKAEKLASLLDENALAKSKNVKEVYDQLRAQIVSSAESLTVSFSSLIAQTDDMIRSYVEANYIAIDENMTLEEKISSSVEQSADQIRLEFSRFAELDVDMVDYLTANFSTYFRFSENGLDIGKIGDGASPIVTRITNERFEYVIAGTDTVLAYFDGSSNKLYVIGIETETVSIGNTTNGYVDFDMTADGLFVRWRK